MVGNGTGYIGQLDYSWLGMRQIPREVLHADCGMTTTYVDVRMAQNVVLALSTDGRIRGWVSWESCAQRAARVVFYGVGAGANGGLRPPLCGRLDSTIHAPGRLFSFHFFSCLFCMRCS